MARIKGVDIPNNKRVEIALTYIYGIGRKLSKTILKDAKVNPDTRAKDLTEEEVYKIFGDIWVDNTKKSKKKKKGYED